MFRPHCVAPYKGSWIKDDARIGEDGIGPFTAVRLVAALKREGCTTIRSEKRSGTSTAKG
jgi:hypothetical protein